MKKLHQEIEKTHTIAMDGCYLLQEDVGKQETVTKTKQRFYYNDGKMVKSDHITNPIMWWILKNKGLSIIGPELTSFHFAVDDQILRDYVIDNMNTYWLHRIQKNENMIVAAHLIPSNMVDMEIEWSIMGMLRQFYTLKECDITSKIDASEYALQHMPERWHPIIKEALHIRKGETIRHYPSKKQRMNDGIKCMKYIWNECNSIYQKNRINMKYIEKEEK